MNNLFVILPILIFVVYPFLAGFNAPKDISEIAAKDGVPSRRVGGGTR